MSNLTNMKYINQPIYDLSNIDASSNSPVSLDMKRNKSFGMQLFKSDSSISASYIFKRSISPTFNRSLSPSFKRPPPSNQLLNKKNILPISNISHTMMINYFK